MNHENKTDDAQASAAPIRLTREELDRQKRDHEEQIHQFREGDEK